jgi:hypothetical protein
MTPDRGASTGCGEKDVRWKKPACRENRHGEKKGRNRRSSGRNEE